MGNPRRANGARRDKIRAQWRYIGAPCALCGKPIDYTLGMVTYYTVDRETGEQVEHRKPHPMSFVVDEIVPVSKGGNPLDFANTQPAHWICNARKGDGSRRIAPVIRPLPQPFDDW